MFISSQNIILHHTSGKKIPYNDIEGYKWKFTWNLPGKKASDVIKLTADVMTYLHELFTDLKYQFQITYHGTNIYCKHRNSISINLDYNMMDGVIYYRLSYYSQFLTDIYYDIKDIGNCLRSDKFSNFMYQLQKKQNLIDNMQTIESENDKEVTDLKRELEVCKLREKALKTCFQTEAQRMMKNYEQQIQEYQETIESMKSESESKRVKVTNSEVYDRQTAEKETNTDHDNPVYPNPINVFQAMENNRIAEMRQRYEKERDLAIERAKKAELEIEKERINRELQIQLNKEKEEFEELRTNCLNLERSLKKLVDYEEED